MDRPRSQHRQISGKPPPTTQTCASTLFWESLYIIIASPRHKLGACFTRAIDSIYQGLSNALLDVAIGHCLQNFLTKRCLSGGPDRRVSHGSRRRQEAQRKPGLARTTKHACLLPSTASRAASELPPSSKTLLCSLQLGCHLLLPGSACT